MVRIALQLSASLEGVTSLQPQSDSVRWYLKLRCTACGNLPDHLQYVCADDSVPLKGGRAHTNLSVRCRLCARDNSLDVVADSLRPLTDSECFQTVVVFECRGLQPVDFSPRGEWTCVGVESGTRFDQVQLTEGEWMEYDEKTTLPVSVEALKWQFVKCK